MFHCRIFQDDVQVVAFLESFSIIIHWQIVLETVGLTPYFHVFVQGTLKKGC